MDIRFHPDVFTELLKMAKQRGTSIPVLVNTILKEKLILTEKENTNEKQTTKN